MTEDQFEIRVRPYRVNDGGVYYRIDWRVKKWRLIPGWGWRYVSTVTNALSRDIQLDLLKRKLLADE